MKTLQVGDYVKNLTEKQFKTILKTQGKILLSYMPEREESFYYKTSILFNLRLIHGEIRLCKTELTYLQFIRRAKNTFK